MDISYGGPSTCAETPPDFYQNVIVMRHGNRVDSFDCSWVTTAPRPWDPPLMEAGLARAFQTGCSFRNDLRSPIHRVFVSPFLRCLQTAAQVVSAITAAAVHHGDSIVPSKLKVSIEYGLCEKLNSKAIPPDVAPRDSNWGFNIAELAAVLPAGSVDFSMERVYEEMPQWEETPTAIRSRFRGIIQTLADKYYSENILLVTHGAGVGIFLYTFLKDTRVFEVDYCGYAKLRRPIFRKDDSFVAGNFELHSVDDTAGIRFSRSES